jgi:transposase
LLPVEGPVSDHRGAASVLSALPNTKVLIADKGYDSDGFRQALENLGIKPCIPSRTGRRNPIQHDQKLYRQRNVIERMFDRLKNWHRIATRYDRLRSHLHERNRHRRHRYLLVMSPEPKSDF